MAQLKRMKEELEAEIAAAEDEIKAVMGDEETLLAGAFKVSWKAVTSSRLDTTALKKAMPDIASKFMNDIPLVAVDAGSGVFHSYFFLSCRWASVFPVPVITV